ncbi:MAG TPA: bifunctional [glutamate--ammonia ligase]-adenylyl-L-tyrosine phosphorylase/[glutamate--ammonia-ligase] adenylyltransferase [Gammaproteobacteria bacterium]|nr:bifunctional [glutamate--ammonia ligase]-adenylyl-L-tyrosine phosphorylase/[glutamate--ammonia-ligase] adenylyltransferase [Gammaproteobacteria bacterium]
MSAPLTPTVALPESVLGTVPEPLRAGVARHWELFTEAAAPAGRRVPGHPDFLKALCRVWAASDFVPQACIAEPGLLGDLLAGGDLLADYRPGELAGRARDAAAGAEDDRDLGERLRRLRRREMVRIAWRDLAGWAALEEVLEDLSALADACIGAAAGRLEQWQRAELGTPRTTGGEPQSLVVLGMGKLGARELNFSSDIDLIFAFPEAGQLGGADGMSHEEFFTRLGRRLIGVLGTATAEGLLFRVDMRLRPYGDSGPLVMSFDALEEYYQSQGREWERYAMIKARPVAGDPGAGQRLMELLRPFVYRRYLDYGAFESLREMKGMIAAQVRRKGREDDIKLGPGGIREVEFIAQAFQLIRGGRDAALRERALLKVLTRLAATRALPEFVTRRLAEAYRFLRRAENRLQALADQQVHRLPADTIDRLRLAFAMGYPRWEAFTADLEHNRQLVEEHFEQVFAAPQAQDNGPGAGAGDEAALLALWAGDLDAGSARDTLRDAGFDDPDEAVRILDQLREGPASRFLGEQGRARLDRLMPMLLGAVGSVAAPQQTLLRVNRLLEAVAGRTAYLSLLVENPMALSQLVRLCAASPWIADYLTGHPILLDELLDPRTLYEPPGREELERQLAERLAGVDSQDLEQQMDVLRHFRHSAVLRVAAADVAGATPLMVVSDYLTAIAEVVLGTVLGLAWTHLEARHGVPAGADGGRDRGRGFAVVAYGKLGGIELGYGSDLDLVFVHDEALEGGRTDGRRALDNSVFFARLGQRIIHILNTLTPAGVLYEVDMRLRPSGASGLLVSSLSAFGDYQRQDAWTWEHQALVRARPVVGDPALMERFQAVRREVLSRRRDPGTLQKQVREMRERMRRELGGRRRGFDLKQHRGGIADIEFMVQYGVLLWSCDHPALLEYTDNIRLLEGFARAGLVPESDVRLLSDAYRAYRARVHQLTLQEEPAVVADDELRGHREAVARLWRQWMEQA